MCPGIPRLECNTIGCVRYVLDTNIVVAGLRSPSGASAALLEGAPQGDFVALLSVALALEYEAVCSEPAQRVASGLSQEDVQTVVSAICGAAEPSSRDSCGDHSFETRRTKWCWRRRSTVTPMPSSLSTGGTTAMRRTGSASTCCPRRMH